MSEPEQTYINFTYGSPYDDIIKNTGLNPDLSINIRYTLTIIRDQLLKNVNLINYLLENSDSVTNINPIDPTHISIKINDDLKLKEMIDLDFVYTENHNTQHLADVEEI